MNDFFIEEIYKQVLRNAQFSMSGHEDIEGVLYDFFDGLSQKTFFGEYGIRTRFLMGAILRIEDLDNWSVKPFESFYFKTFKEVHKDKILSFYFSILKKGKFTNLSMVLSSLFGTDIDFRIKINKYTDNHSFCHYRPEDRVFEINLSQNIFRNEYIKIESQDYLKNKFSNLFSEIFKAFDNEMYLAICGNDRKATLKKNVLYNESDFKKVRPYYDKLFREIYNESEVSKLFPIIKRELESYIKHDNYKIFIQYVDTNNQNKQFERLIWGSLALAWICFYYDCTIEYCMSIAKVDYNPDNDKFKLNTNTIYKRNLGGIIVGYDSNYELTSKDRVILNIISDRITSTVAGDYMSRFSNILRKKNRDLTQAFKVLNLWNKNNKIPKEEYQTLINNKQEWHKTEEKVKIKMEEGINSLFQSNIAKIGVKVVEDFLIRRRVFLYFKYTGNDFDEAIYKTHKALQANHSVKDAKTSSIVNNFYTCFGFKNDQLNEEFYLPEETDWLKTKKLL